MNDTYNPGYVCPLVCSATVPAKPTPAAQMKVAAVAALSATRLPNMNRRVTSPLTTTVRVLPPFACVIAYIWFHCFPSQRFRARTGRYELDAKVFSIG